MAMTEVGHSWAHPQQPMHLFQSIRDTLYICMAVSGQTLTQHPQATQLS